MTAPRDSVNPWRHGRRPSDSPDVCACGCGRSMAGLYATKVYFSDRCKVAAYNAAAPKVETAAFTTGDRKCRGHEHVFSFGESVCRCGAFEVNDSPRGMTRRKDPA